MFPLSIYSYRYNTYIDMRYYDWLGSREDYYRKPVVLQPDMEVCCTLFNKFLEMCEINREMLLDYFHVFLSLTFRSVFKLAIYLLVNIQKTMENHHF